MVREVASRFRRVAAFNFLLDFHRELDFLNLIIVHYVGKPVFHVFLGKGIDVQVVDAIIVCIISSDWK
jgi:hypothetical protein